MITGAGWKQPLRLPRAPVYARMFGRSNTRCSLARLGTVVVSTVQAHRLPSRLFQTGFPQVIASLASSRPAGTVP